MEGETVVPKVAAALAEVQGVRAASKEAFAVAKVEQVEQVETVETTAACSRGQMPHMRRKPRRTSRRTGRPRSGPVAA